MSGIDNNFGMQILKCGQEIHPQGGLTKHWAVQSQTTADVTVKAWSAFDPRMFAYKSSILVTELWCLHIDLHIPLSVAVHS